MKPIKPIRWRLARYGILGLLVVAGTAWANPGSFWFDFKGTHTAPPVILNPGQKVSFQFCATADVAAAAHQETWPGTPLGVTIRWTVPVKGSIGASPWGNKGVHLPKHATMMGPFADGRYCSALLVTSYADFPNDGNWTLEATIDGTRIGELREDWKLTPRTSIAPLHGLIGNHKLVIPPGGLPHQGNGQQQNSNQQKLRGRPTVPSTSSSETHLTRLPAAQVNH